MDETKLKQMIDFLSIALEQLERGNYDIVEDFVGDVYEQLKDEL